MMKAEKFYEEYRLHGRTDNITSNPDPNYSELFYQNIFYLMEEYAQSQLKESEEENKLWLKNYNGLNKLYHKVCKDRETLQSIVFKQMNFEKI